MNTIRFFRYLALTLVLACLGAGAANAQSGTCGANLTWTLSNGTLTIRGTGAMTDFSVSSASWNAYRNSITNAVIENGVTNIGNYAFYFCERLTSITIPNSVTRIGNYAFDNCKDITSVTVPNNVTSIGNNAFQQCKSLTTVVIGNNVKSIGSTAFQFCENLTSVTIGNSVTDIGGYAFNRCESLTSISIPNSVKAIENYTFANCTALNSVTVGNSVTDIYQSAFENCRNLTSVTIPNSTRFIGMYAFRDCTGLTSISIGSGVTSMYYAEAFSGCTSLAAINVDGNNSTYSSENGVLYNKNKTTLLLCPADKTGVCIIPASVTSIAGSPPFYYCTALTAFDVDSNNQNYSSESGVLFNKNKTVLIRYPADKTDSHYTVPGSVTDINSYAFKNCTNLISITVPNSVTNIGSYAFSDSDCTGLTAINVDSNNPNYSSVNGVLFNKNKTTLIRYPEGKTGAYTIPNSVTSIDNYAFAKCTGLTSVTIPSNVTNFGRYAFSACIGLTQIHNRRTVPQTIAIKVGSIYTNVFYDVNKQTCILYVPAGSRNAYLNADVWKDFTNIVEENSTGIETVSAHSPALYPNPVVNGQLTIENGQLNDVVQIYDISGRMVETLHATSLHNGVQTIDVSALPAGVYFVKTNNGQTLKFIKK